ncbi:MAG: CPBP family intramembrane metalloprotease [Parachlamydiales bacterium]|nr:CPBP family intramembrane metalloprotease [Parachlamydiales bacterium]
MKHIIFLFILTAAFAQEQAEIQTPSITQSPIAKPEILVLKPKVNPETATFLSSLFPGLGHFYLGDSKTAGSLMGAASMELGALVASAVEHRKEAAIFSLIALTNTVNYGVYAAYRDARTINGQEFYHYKMPMESLPELTTAPFRWSVLKKPEVWGGCLGALAIAVCVSHFAFPSEARIMPTSIIDDGKVSPWFPIAALPVGVGEEALFRGVIQSRFAESLGPWGSIVASSLVFGAAHVPNAFLLPQEERWRYFSFSVPLITGIGAYLGWLTQKNVSLKESVAVHTWYDFTLFSMAAIAQSAAIGCPSFSYSLPF